MDVPVIGRGFCVFLGVRQPIFSHVIAFVTYNISTFITALAIQGIKKERECRVTTKGPALCALLFEEIERGGKKGRDGSGKQRQD